MQRDLIFDISVLARTPGPAVGIVRVTRELARWAAANRPNTTFVIFDSNIGAFRAVNTEYFAGIMEGRTILDHSEQPNRDRGTMRLIDRLPPMVRWAALWIRNPRRRALMALEQRRLAGRADAALAARVQLALMTGKHRAKFFDPSGQRIELVPFERAIGPPVTLTAQIVVCTGSDWSPEIIAHVERRKQSNDLRVAFISYDMIPLLHPEYFPERAATNFRSMFHRLVPMADLVLVTAHQVAADFAAYCSTHRLRTTTIRVFRPGADLPAKSGARTASLPAGLEPGRYALFVSTIEPRKGHGLLFAVWKRLLADGVVQAQGFKLVFVGRRGWLVDDFYAEMESHPSFGESLLVLSGLGDEELSALYRNAAFALFPSLYEGYGLPVVEAFQHGKAVLASTGGALPEVVGDLCPCLDPRDEDAWFDAMRRWIAEPETRALFEKAVRERFTHPKWTEAAANFFGIIDGEVGTACPVAYRNEARTPARGNA